MSNGTVWSQSYPPRPGGRPIRHSRREILNGIFNIVRSSACGGKRHLLVDTLRLVLPFMITAANVQDREAARTLLTPLGGQFRRLRIIWADGAYAGWLQDWVWGLRKRGKIRLEIVRKPKGQRGSSAVP